MADSSFRKVIVKKKIGACRVEPVSNDTQEEVNKSPQAELNNTTEKESAKDFNKGLEEIFLFDLLTK